MKEVTGPLEKENLKIWIHISGSVAEPHVRGNSVIHCVAPHR